MMLFFKVIAALLIAQTLLVDAAPNGTPNDNPNGEEACQNQGFNTEDCANVGCCHFNEGQCWSSVGREPCHNGTPNDNPNGEEACQNQGFGAEDCAKVGCCHFNEGQCWSSVGRDPCYNYNFLLEGYEGWKDGAIVYSDPPSDGKWEICEKVTVVFGVAVCITQRAYEELAKCNHIVNVFYQLLDNDADGIPDDEEVWTFMLRNRYMLFVPATGEESEELWSKLPDVDSRFVMNARTNEAAPNSCQVPANRGASNTDRSTWQNFVDTYNMDCSLQRDNIVEEIFHLIQRAAVNLWPSKWGTNFGSEAGAAVKAANGDCGFGYSNNYIDPSTNECTGQYAYWDVTCNEGCTVDEGVHWASITYIGGLYTLEKTYWARHNFLMCTPDKNMEVHPKGYPNAISLQSGSPALYALVSDTTSEGHKWLPLVMPDGKYQGFHLLAPVPEFEDDDDPQTETPTFYPTFYPTESCEDDTSFKFKNKNKKMCGKKWLQKFTRNLKGRKRKKLIKLCKKKSGKQRVYDFCKATCALVDLGPCA